MKLPNTQCHSMFGKGDSRTTQQGKTRTQARAGWLFCAGQFALGYMIGMA